MAEPVLMRRVHLRVWQVIALLVICLGVPILGLLLQSLPLPGRPLGVDALSRFQVGMTRVNIRAANGTPTRTVTTPATFEFTKLGFYPEMPSLVGVESIDVFEYWNAVTAVAVLYDGEGRCIYVHVGRT